MPGVLAASSSNPSKQSVMNLFADQFWCLPRVLEGPFSALRSSIVKKMRLPRSTLVSLTLLYYVWAESRKMMSTAP